MHFTTFILATIASASATTARALEPQRRAVTTMGLPNPAFRIDQAVDSQQAFRVDLPATECTLFYRFRPGFPVAQDGASQINVRDVDGNAPGAVVGTFSINAFDGLPHVINTFQCRDPLTVRFEIASDDRPGSVRFDADAENGIFLSYNH
ncbi:hypothetical protein DL766_003204 [Monosporascus sp. MC13-8B]|uniref:Ubiquitin 3 binding protein But2 C-terminal domain-containing protein n=1 Tax=Monosporascus cannonballus TaxID=155416 RepID=A0ABY0H176_9PEZI|nr:hypothetical protein DL762_006711 [Monosporascus cannonballus]RYO92531.1 hypothetical protein DL763_004660 [Monosporascus cannonballus]RYP33932.1 hypothetical protein DL766_003204 [Monosporascus sp. MC13-8B]